MGQAGQSEEMVGRVVKEVMRLLENSGGRAGSGCVFREIDSAVQAGRDAQKQLVSLSFEKRAQIIEAIRAASLKNVKELSLMAVEETGMGVWEHKIKKNTLAALKTPGLEDLRPDVDSGDGGLTLTELSPFGLIGSITPTTNPSETIICNAIGMIAAGNAVVFSPHPSAKRTSLRTVEILNAAIEGAGGPPCVITSVAEPTIEAANKMMAHKDVDLLVATGGPAVVKAVLSSGKKAIGAGAGNPPAVVDETADIEKAARDIVDGCSLDNNIPCVAEKEVIAVDQVADYLLFHMKGSGAYFIEDRMALRALEDLLVSGGQVNKKFIGKSARHILEAIGVSPADDVKIIAAQTDLNHPFVQHEMMMPVLPVVRVKDFAQAVEAALEAEHGYRHTAVIHSKNVDRLSEFAKRIQTTVFVKNGPSYAGLGLGAQGFASFTIAGPTGEGMTSAKTFTRRRRCVLVDGFNIR